MKFLQLSLNMIRVDLAQVAQLFLNSSFKLIVLFEMEVVLIPGDKGFTRFTDKDFDVFHVNVGFVRTLEGVQFRIQDSH